MGVDFLSSPIGWLLVESDGSALIAIKRVDSRKNALPDVVTNEAIGQLREYFSGTRRRFDLPVAFSGSEFCRKVARAASDIPFGSTVTYGELARSIGQPKAARAVGSALHRNELLIVVPCHRVVAASGLGGFALGLDAKRVLLELENCT